MKNKKQAVSIVEAMVIILIVVVGIIGVYNIYTRSLKATNNIENRIQAIQIAKEGIEAMMNIRDTNWILYSSDKKNCWRNFNYDKDCIGKDDFLNKINDAPYKIYRDENGRWLLEKPIVDTFPDEYLNSEYRDFFKVSLDEKGLYTQSGGTALPQNFTRELIVEPVEAIEGEVTYDNAIRVTSKVIWVDSSSASPQDVVLEMVLTNHSK